jgi:hypothetical protein
MLSPSDIIVRPASLTDRLAAEAQPEGPAVPEPTPSTMAERFAPGGQKAAAIGSAELTPEPPGMPGLIPQRGRASSASRWLLLTSMFVSLVPTAIILALLWQGAIKLPSSSGNAPAVVYDHEEIAGVQEASLAAVPAMQVDAKPDIALTAPDEIAAKTGDEVDFEIAIDSVEALPARSVIAIRAMPEGATFSQGRPYGDKEWNLRPDEIGDLRLRLPKTASGSADMRVELMAADGTVLASASTKLDIVPDPKSALILRADEGNRVTDLIAHGQKMIDVGYFAGARAYFRRAAEAGSGEAALRLAATYDQEFIDRLGVQGIKADPGEARNWYERAKQLGVNDPDGKLKALKEDWTNHDKPVQATDIGSASPPIAATEPSGEASAAVAGIGLVPVPTAASPELPSGRDEWVALVGYANVRTAPSSAAETIRVAEKGTKLRVTGRKGNWVQVTDPATAEVGWVYARYIETAESPAR